MLRCYEHDVDMNLLSWFIVIYWLVVMIYWYIILWFYPRFGLGLGVFDPRHLRKTMLIHRLIVMIHYDEILCYHPHFGLGSGAFDPRHYSKLMSMNWLCLWQWCWFICLCEKWMMQSSLMQSYPRRALDRRLQVDWARDARESPKVLMSLRADFGRMG